MSPVFEMGVSHRSIWVLTVIALLLCGCDEPTRADPAADDSMEASTAPRSEIEIESVVPLIPDLTTHLAINSSGALLWVQETDEGQDVTFVMGSQGVPLATPLTSQNILKGLGVSKARGSIQSLAGARDDFVYAYFSGTAGDRAVCCVGQYSLTSSRFLVLAETETLLRLTGLGESLEKSRGRIIAGRKGLWLWLTNEQSTAGIRISTEQGTGTLRFEKAFTAINAEEGAIPLTGGIEVWGGPEESLYFADRRNRILRHVLPDGKETASYAMEYAAISQPVFDPRSGTFLVGQQDVTPPSTSHAVLISPGQVNARTLSFDHAQNLAGVTSNPLLIVEFLLERPGHFIGYDAASGHVLRFKMKR